MKRKLLVNPYGLETQTEFCRFSKGNGATPGKKHFMNPLLTAMFPVLLPLPLYILRGIVLDRMVLSVRHDCRTVVLGVLYEGGAENLVPELRDIIFDLGGLEVGKLHIMIHAPLVSHYSAIGGTVFHAMPPIAR